MGIRLGCDELLDKEHAHRCALQVTTVGTRAPNTCCGFIP